MGRRLVMKLSEIVLRTGSKVNITPDSTNKQQLSGIDETICKSAEEALCRNIAHYQTEIRQVVIEVLREIVERTISWKGVAQSASAQSIFDRVMSIHGLGVFVKQDKSFHAH